MILYYSAVPLSEEEPAWFRLTGKLSVLFSYPIVKKKPELLDLPWFDKVFLDSGAFTVWTKGNTIDIHEYIDFLIMNKNRCATYAALDVIGSAMGSLQNYKIMKKAGLDPLPCLHIGEEEKVLNFYCEEAGHVGLGGVAKTKHTKRVKWYDSVFRDRTDIKFHGFAVVHMKLLRRYPWHSVDGTFAATAARRGGIITPFGHYSIIKGSPYERLYHTASPGVKKNILDHVESYGFDMKRLCLPKESIYRFAFNAKCLQAFIKTLSEKTYKNPIGGFNL